jgi:hypothetical protein
MLFASIVGKLDVPHVHRFGQFAAIRFSTRDLPERKRLLMWREEIARSLLRVDIEPLSDLPF